MVKFRNCVDLFRPTCRQMANNDFVIGGRRVPCELVGPFQDSSAVNDSRELRRCLADDGYVFLRGVLDKGEVLAARQEVFSRLVKSVRSSRRRSKASQPATVSDVSLPMTWSPSGDQ